MPVLSFHNNVANKGYIVSADNGLTETASHIVQLGGTLIQNTTIDIGGFDFEVSGLTTPTTFSSFLISSNIPSFSADGIELQYSNAANEATALSIGDLSALTYGSIAAALTSNIVTQQARVVVDGHSASYLGFEDLANDRETLFFATSQQAVMYYKNTNTADINFAIADVNGFHIGLNLTDWFTVSPVGEITITSYPDARDDTGTFTPANFLYTGNGGELYSAPLSFLNNNFWSTTGNAGTIDGTNFIGTTDNVPFTIKVNNQKAGRIDNTNGLVFLGYQAGDANQLTGGIAAYDNVAIGDQSLANNIYSPSNVAIGAEALLHAGESVAAGNFVVGYLYVIQTIGTTDFTTIGAASNTVGLAFTASGVGSGSGTAAAYAQQNVAIGAQALYSIVNSTTNVAIGVLAFGAMITGKDNVAVGHSNGTAIVLGDNNTLIGSTALGGATGGSNNIAIGFISGFDATTESGNIYIGNATQCATFTDIISFGHSAAPTANNQFALASTISGLLFPLNSTGAETGYVLTNTDGNGLADWQPQAAQSGTDTPTLTNVANVTASSVNIDTMYTQIVDPATGETIVTAQYSINIEPTVTATHTEIDVTLPVASNPSADLAGQGAFDDTGGHRAIIVTPVDSTHARAAFTATAITSRLANFSITYRAN